MLTPDAKSKTRFVIIDAVGVCEQCKSEKDPSTASRPRRSPSLRLHQGWRHRSRRRLRPGGQTQPRRGGHVREAHADAKAHAAGKGIDTLVGGLVAAIDDANVEAKARR
ncbi:MAG: hypothetical protein IPM33_10675 [Phycisphaerales bacterium]|nr:hypothetical protein [Phycisphaerales bacterium]